MSWWRRFHAADVRWHDRLLARTIFHQGFWVQRRLRQMIAFVSPLGRGRLIDVGCGTSPYRHLFTHITDYVGVDLSPDSGYRGNQATVYADAGHLPYPSGEFDTVLCTEVLEHVPSPHDLVEELSRITNLNGHLILSTPFCYPLHEASDYTRHSAAGLTDLVERHGFRGSIVRPLMATPLTLAVLLNLYLMDGCGLWSRGLYPLCVLLRPFYLLAVAAINLLGWVAERVLPAYNLPSHHVLVAVKR